MQMRQNKLRCTSGADAVKDTDDGDEYENTHNDNAQNGESSAVADEDGKDNANADKAGQGQ